MSSHFPKMKKSSQKGMSGQTYIEHFITEQFEWIYHAIPVEKDFGIDAYLEIVDDESVTGKQIGIQIKHGDSYFSKSSGGFKYKGKDKHLNYYLNIEQPVILLIIDDSFSRINWVLFEIEKTSPMKNGWWIEIPNNQTLTLDTKSDWMAYINPPIDYQDIIRRNWQIDNVIQNSELGVVAIPKDEILSMSFSYINSFFKRLTKNREQTIKSRSSLDIYFPEYDDDHREIVDIPEIQNWLKESINQKVPWFYFLSYDNSVSSGLKILLHLLTKETDRTKYDKGFYIEIDPKSIDKFFDLMFENLNFFTESNGIDSPNSNHEINKEISLGLLDFYTKLLSTPPPTM